MSLQGGNQRGKIFWDEKDRQRLKTILERTKGTVQLTFNFMYGPEQPNNNSNNRFLIDWIGAFQATKKLTFMANVDYAQEENDPLNSGRDSQWYGVAVYAKYEFTGFSGHRSGPSISMIKMG